MAYNVGIDIGGTFTDCVVTDDAGRVTLGKALSTPDDFSVGTLDAVRDAAKNLSLADEGELLRATRLFFHACTVGDNTLLTRSGPKTGLITTRGFADTVLMMRGKITEGLTEAEAANLAALTKPEPLIPCALIAEVTERIDYKGAVIVPLDPGEAERVIDHLIARGAEAIAVALLWSISNDAHERTVEEIIRKNHPSVFVSLSSEVAPFLGEYERTITTAFNAYIGPRISSYLARLGKLLRSKGLRREPLIMQAYGGVLDGETSARNAIGIIESGPAAGVVGSQFLGELIGEANILVTDMGGTTFKVGVIREGGIERNYAPVILGHNVAATKIWVESIGAGGGSIAWIDEETGLLKVGPRGAGASPGPVCYGLGGTAPTVSDADLLLGYLNEKYFLGGRMSLDKAAASRALEEMGMRLGMSGVEVASGIYRITNAHMADLIRRATVERGYDPREFVVFAVGGAGPVHGARYAAELGIRQVIIPPTAPVHGALGLVASDVVLTGGKACRLVFPPDPGQLNATFAGLIERAYQGLAAMGFEPGDVLLQRSLDMRYRYQCNELNVPLPPGTGPLTDADLERLDGAFDTLYEQSYGRESGYREAGKEIVACRVTASATVGRPRIQRHERSGLPAGAAMKGRREVFFEEQEGFVPTEIYDFDLLQPGMELSGPAVVESVATTIVVNPRDRALLDELRNLRLFIGS